MIESEVKITVKDDLSGAKGAERVEFGFDGLTYEIDLTPGNKRAMEKVLKRFIDCARVTPPHGASIAGGTHKRVIARTEVRQWARDNGHTIGNRGRVPSAILDAYAASLAVKTIDQEESESVSV